MDGNDLRNNDNLFRQLADSFDRLANDIEIIDSRIHETEIRLAKEESFKQDLFELLKKYNNWFY